MHINVTGHYCVGVRKLLIAPYAKDTIEQCYNNLLHWKTLDALHYVPVLMEVRDLKERSLDYVVFTFK